MEASTTGSKDKKMLKILQVNLNRCKQAQDLVIQIAAENKYDIVIISEPNKGTANACAQWYKSRLCDVVIIVLSRGKYAVRK